MDQWATRDLDGNRLVWAWGESDDEGYYTPTITVVFTDNPATALRAAIAAHVVDVRARHVDVVHEGAVWCDSCDMPYPCPDILAADALEEATRGA